MTHTPETLPAAIRALRYAYEGSTGMKATCLYLGYHEDAILRRLGERYAMIRDLTTPVARARWMDLEIFVIDGEEHLAVGNPQFPKP